MKFGLQTTLNKKISRRYARAYFDSAEEKGSIEKIYADTLTLSQMLGESAEFKDFILNPYHPPGLCEAVLMELLKDRVEPLTHDFLMFLTEKGRLNILGGILDTFVDLYHHYHGITKIKIISAVPLAAQQVDAICKRLKARWKRGIFAETAVDPDLIGGFQIKSGDQILDFSMKSQLENYRRQVINA